MNTVQEIKARAEARKWADIEGIMRVMQPTLEANAKARWEAEVKAAKGREKAVRAKTRKGKVNLALRRVPPAGGYARHRPVSVYYDCL